MLPIADKHRIKEFGFQAVFFFAAAFALIAVAIIAVYLLAQGLPAFFEVGFFEFLFGSQWQPSENKFGILPFMLGTIYVTVGALLFGGTLGVFTAIFITKFCPKKLKKPLEQIVNLLAGIPSVLFGLFGILVIVPIFRELDANYLGFGILPTTVVLGMMILPTVVGFSKNALQAVPQSYYEGALALGVTHEQAVFSVVVPAAKGGIFTAIVLGMGRAMGETMAAVMVLGNGTGMPTSLIQPIRTLTANIVLEMEYASGSKVNILIANGVVLFVFVLIINISLSFMKGKRERRDYVANSDKHRKKV